jgi:hypothetical protein
MPAPLFQTESLRPVDGYQQRHWQTLQPAASFEAHTGTAGTENTLLLLITNPDFQAVVSR